ncbi:MAG: TlpA disulfide reductase family protein [bacterium]
MTFEKRLRLAGTATLLAGFLAGPLLPGEARAEDWSSWESKLAGHELRSLDGETVAVSSLRGQVVVVNFWASWCAPCKKELRVLDGWREDLAGTDARILAVSIDNDVKKAEDFAKKSGLDLAFFHDGTEGLARSLDLPSLPCTIVVGPDGRIAEVARDGNVDTLRHLESTVRSLANRRTSSTPSEEGRG